MGKKEYNIGLLGNIIIKGTIDVITGLHIGASSDTVEIGGIDSPVIKHPVTGAPYIPGSSLKGKMRSFTEKQIAVTDRSFKFNRSSGTRQNQVKQHVCDDIDYSYKEDDNKGSKNCCVCRIYGATGDNGGRNHPARIIVRDCKLMNEEKIKQDALYIFEAKMENAIDRITASANPRTIERVPAGANFEFEIVYKVQVITEYNNENQKFLENDLEHLSKDIQNIFEALSLIEKDGLGGSVSRGYGQVEFSLTIEECKYYKIGGGSELFLPEKEGNIISDLEELRVNNFDNLKSLVKS
ncbi:CRISPR-associated RAMP protein [Candidatus Scalindua japonica]|uniref:CRISPR system Cms endoribonuclease Csm3 n=1 Tax=Candidatus Scalindua japonica TaxID=1284222 RepID=A0A286U218_9BACT|nr:type III-A CRISPR-associated RAMP protein Csm3 [Candidatus Scalindua japonica]GAX62162.1 CRISPR-associated RAMP protein [Candidatus Scalindua japonica]